MKQTTPGAPAPEPIPYSEINPLITGHGYTGLVSASLEFLAKVFALVDPAEGIHLSFDEAFGLSHLLQSCSAALDHTGKGDEA
jgi:hypothetical protein